MSGLRATMADVRSKPPNGIGMCTRGLKAWCDAHGYDFREFLRNGASVEYLESLDDPMTQRLAKFVRERAAREAAERKSL